MTNLVSPHSSPALHRHSHAVLWLILKDTSEFMPLGSLELTVHSVWNILPRSSYEWSLAITPNHFTVPLMIHYGRYRYNEKELCYLETK